VVDGFLYGPLGMSKSHCLCLHRPIATSTRVYLFGLRLSALRGARAIRDSRTRPTQLVSEASRVPEVQTGSRT
jgi:hypothetical protein